MKRVCAWCNKLQGVAEDDGALTAVTTHCICDDCANNLEFQLGVPLETFLASLKMPTVVVDGEARVLAGNADSQEYLATGITEPGKQKLGDVFECAYARMPGGCGHAIHCSGCAIRMAVEETYRTGASCQEVPALIHQGSDSGPHDADLLITTEKLWDFILLKLEPLAAKSGKEKS
jgi:hypothetical protein